MTIDEYKPPSNSLNTNSYGMQCSLKSFKECNSVTCKEDSWPSNYLTDLPSIFRRYSFFSNKLSFKNEKNHVFYSYKLWLWLFCYISIKSFSSEWDRYSLKMVMTTRRLITPYNNDRSLLFVLTFRQNTKIQLNMFTQM